MKTNSPRWQIASSLFELPSGPGCYVVILGGVAVYVGSAVNLYARFILHRGTRSAIGDCLSSNKGKLTVKYRRSVRYGDWAMRELRLIKRLAPELNVCGIRGALERPRITRNLRHRLTEAF